MSPEERKREANWFDVGIIKGTSCTVSSYYLPNGDLEKSEIDVEVGKGEIVAVISYSKAFLNLNDEPHPCTDHLCLHEVCLKT